MYILYTTVALFHYQEVITPDLYASSIGVTSPGERLLSSKYR